MRKQRRRRSGGRGGDRLQRGLRIGFRLRIDVVGLELRRVRVVERRLRIELGVGRGRAKVSVDGCPSDTSPTIKLPGSASGGDVPSLALTTGKGDTLECTMHRLLMDGAVTFFQGGGGVEPAGAQPSSALWASSSTLDAYDALIFSCEAAATANANSDALASYVAAGGMAYVEHWGYSILDDAPFTSENVATWNTGSQFFTGTTPNAVIETSTAAGVGFQAWLSQQGALTDMEVPMLNDDPATNVASLGSSCTLWLAADSSASTPGSPLLFAWSSGGGRIVYGDYHVATAVGDYGTTPGSNVTSGSYPSGCEVETALKPSEIAFMYMLYEELSCGR